MKDLALKALSTDALPPFLEKRDTLVETKGLNVEETAGNMTEAEDINSYGRLDFPYAVVCFFCLPANSINDIPNRNFCTECFNSTSCKCSIRK